MNIMKGQSLNDEEKKQYLSMINNISDTSYKACMCWLAVHPRSSVLPGHRKGVEYAISVERLIDTAFSECSTISKNDSLFVLKTEDMERIKRLYEEWFFIWQTDKANPKRALDGTEFKWVDLSLKKSHHAKDNLRQDCNKKEYHKQKEVHDKQTTPGSSKQYDTIED